jgi:Ni,Fe-hydrogenase III large subunit
MEEDRYIILRTNISKPNIESITEIHPEAMIFEYELQNQFGLCIQNIIQDNYVKFQISNKKGIRFNIDIQSAIMKQVSVSLGFSYRDIENNLILNKTEDVLAKMNIYFGSCSSAHQICFVQCVEDLLNHDLSDFHTKSRILMLELERGINHSLWMLMILFDLGFKEIAKILIKIRNELLSTRLELLGTRSESAWILNPIYDEEKKSSIIGKLNSSMNSLKSLHKSNQLDPVYEYIDQAFNPIHTPVNEYGLVGPLARTYGFAHELRVKQPDPIDMDIKRSSVNPVNIFDTRLRESISSINGTLTIIKTSTFTTQADIKHSHPMRINAYSIHSIEAPNGRLTYLVHTDRSGVIDHVRICIPSLVNFSSLIYFVKNKKLKWLLIISRIFDMGIDPLDHIQITDETGKSFSPTAFSFRKLAQEAILHNTEIYPPQE